ncbi:26S proteasome subunit RPN7-domain-containing protein [Mariannaea sp. PMI_226]|nr:26S proteasome subunit RPN7-domain-containing protein [Mariannaea sp. PMI_226]
MVEAKAGKDVSRYLEAWECLRLAAPDEPEAQRDHAWIDHTERKNKDETARLTSELKAYKNNLIKESIRMGQEDLGRHYEQIGELSDAAEAYSRMRQDVSTTRHIMDCGKHLVSISLQRRDWNMVINNLGKVTGVQTSEDDTTTAPYAKIISGIGLLGLGHYEDAAKNFIQIDSSASAFKFDDIVSPNDVAIYGGLLALATMERKDLQEQVLDNQSFRTFLEFEPHIRKAIALFVSGRYSQCLSILATFRNDYLLDIYLQKHIPAIYSQIRNKCIVQYFKPFSCVTLESLNESFASPGQSIEEELVSLIRNGVLKARIDTQHKLLVAVKPDPRLAMQKQALDVASYYEREAKERLRRMSLIAAGLEVVGSKLPSLADRAVRDEWFDDTNIHQGGVKA